MTNHSADIAAKRKCSRCAMTKAATDFFQFVCREPRTRTRWHPWCRECKRTYGREAARRKARRPRATTDLRVV